MPGKKCSSLLIIGGYGTFGGRLVRQLADIPDLTLIVGGRSLTRAQLFTAAVVSSATLVPVVFDRDGDVVQQIESLRPDIVIDASGPFQSYGDTPYRVAEAAILIGAHYLDLADGSDFVHHISRLDTSAQERSVFVLAGASTCPSLTTAVARAISDDLDSIESVSGGISPSPFAGMGKNVVRAIAGYAGKPVTVLQHGEASREISFASACRFTIAPPGEIPLAPMTFSLIDVPDLRLPGDPGKPVSNTWFGVSTMPAIYHRALRVLARAVTLGILPTLRPLAGVMHFVMNHLAWGEHRGGLFVEVRGTDRQGISVRRSWHLIASGDSGPTVPTLAATAIVRRCIDGCPPAPGARAAASELPLDDFLPMLDELDIRYGQRSEGIPDDASVFRQVLGDAWSTVPRQIRKLHEFDRVAAYAGRASVQRGRRLLARAVGGIVGFPPPAADVALSVTMTLEDRRETWSRDFGGYTFSSQLSPGQGRFDRLICERFGPCTFGMALHIDHGVLRYVPRRWSFLGIPMPKWMMPCGDMYEAVIDGRFHFHVDIKLPFVGRLVTYAGWLEREDADSSSSQCTG